MKGKRPVLIYFCYQTDSEVPNTSIYSAIFLASPYYNYLKSTASTTMICWRCHSNSINTGSSLPNISDAMTWKRRNVIAIYMIRNNRIIMKVFRLYSVYHHFQQYFSYIMAVSFIWWRKPTTFHKSLTNFITYTCNVVSSTPRH
jgi:hypothetical protein